MMDGSKLILDEREVMVSFDGRKLSIEGKKHNPKRASLDARRILPLWVTVLIMISVVFVSMVIGALIGRIDAAIISTGIGVAIAVVVLIALSRMEPVLCIETRDGCLELKGPIEDLRSLYYRISKLTIRKMNEKERESASHRDAGITRGDSYLDANDLKKVKGDLKRSVVVGSRMVTQICPECGNDELYYEGGLMAGHVYHCKRCDYIGSFVIEKEMDLRRKD